MRSVAAIMTANAADPTRAADCENSYRRGYSQGFVAAVAALESFASVPAAVSAQLDSFCLREIYAWRGGRRGYLPPVFRAEGTEYVT